MEQYEVTVTIRRGQESPWTFRMATDLTSDYVPVRVQRRYFEEHINQVIAAATDKLFADELPVFSKRVPE